MSEYETTKFVNIDDKDFTFYYDDSRNPNGYTVKAKEERIFPAFLAEHGAVHLVDKILRSKHKIKDSRQDTPLRRSLLGKILPELPEINPKVKTLTPEQEKESTKELLKKQQEQINTLSGKVDELSGKKEGKPKGRPKIVKAPEAKEASVPEGTLPPNQSSEAK